MSPKDHFAHDLGAYLNKVDDSVRIVEWDESATDYSMLPTVARSGQSVISYPSVPGFHMSN